jgi:hypothetical protein
LSSTSTAAARDASRPAPSIADTIPFANVVAAAVDVLDNAGRAIGEELRRRQ